MPPPTDCMPRPGKRTVSRHRPPYTRSPGCWRIAQEAASGPQATRDSSPPPAGAPWALLEFVTWYPLPGHLQQETQRSKTARPFSHHSPAVGPHYLSRYRHESEAKVRPSTESAYRPDKSHFLFFPLADPFGLRRFLSSFSTSGAALIPSAISSALRYICSAPSRSQRI
jgi:hypothetical protein